MTARSATDRHARQVSTALFVALLTTAVDLGPALAHAFELPNKIGLSREDYLTVQQIYAGWNLIAVVLVLQLAAIVSLVVLLRHDRRALAWALSALGALVAAQLLFWIFTYPANTATVNWTRLPENWQSLRSRWEYSHLGGAICQLGVMIALIRLALLDRVRT